MAEIEYILGYSEAEAQRLILQAEILRPATERLLRDAGLAPGMRVLDVGCGVGDVALLAAKIIGPSGVVVGVDRNPGSITAAENRARRAELNIQFRTAKLEDRPELGRFDMAIGRYVLVHSPDPAAFVRDAASYVRPGGVIAFHEPLVISNVQHLGRAQLWNQIYGLFDKGSRAAMPHVDVAIRLTEVFNEAGLSGAQVFCDVVVGGGPDCPFYAWTALTVASMLPFLEKAGIASAARLDVPTLEHRLREEAVELHSQLMFTPSFCGWASRP